MLVLLPTGCGTQASNSASLSLVFSCVNGRNYDKSQCCPHEKRVCEL